jgi:hypothetical protein
MSQSPLGIQRYCRAIESASLRGRLSAPLAGLVWLAVGCSAAATGMPPVEQTSSAGATSSGGMTSAGAGNSTSAAGAANAASGAPGSAGGSSAGTGSSQAGAGGTKSSGGSAGASTTTGAGGHCNSTGPNGEAFYDGFEDGEYMTCPEWLDADPTLGGMWSVKTDGDTKVLAQSAAVSDWVIAVSGDYTLTDQTVEAKVKFTSSPGMIGIFARFQDARDFYYLYLDGSNIIVRGKVNNSSITSVKAKVPAVEGTWYTLKLSVIGSTSDSATGEFDDVTVTTP